MCTERARSFASGHESRRQRRTRGIYRIDRSIGTVSLAINPVIVGAAARERERALFLSRERVYAAQMDIAGLGDSLLYIYVCIYFPQRNCARARANVYENPFGTALSSRLRRARRKRDLVTARAAIPFFANKFISRLFFCRADVYIDSAYNICATIKNLSK